MIIAVDFDGTLCEGKWPGIGKANNFLIRSLAKRRSQGDKLILWTCREKRRLDEAVQWCKERGLLFDAVNENLPEMIAQFGNDCRKIRADVYIDDKAYNKMEELPWNVNEDQNYNSSTVDHPANYNIGGIETIDYNESLGFGEGYCIGYAIKYLIRAGHRDNKMQDLQKAAWYVDMAIQECLVQNAKK